MCVNENEKGKECYLDHCFCLNCLIRLRYDTVKFAKSECLKQLADRRENPVAYVCFIQAEAAKRER